MDLVVGHGQEAGEDVPEVGAEIDAATTVAFDDRVEDGSPLPGSGFAHEEPVFLSAGGGGMAFSKRLLSISTRPSPRSTSSVVHWANA